MKTQKDQLNRIKLYMTAVSFLGVDASPKDEAIDDVGCADSVSQVVKFAFPEAIKGSISTAELFTQLHNSKRFARVSDIRAGDIIISPTGMGTNPKMPHGHVGIVGEDEVIMSNNSNNGLWTANYTVTTWADRYRKIGGYPLYFFRALM